MWKITRKKLGRAEPVREGNEVRGHALFVRFMERKGLVDCVRYFPETMTLGQLRRTTVHELSKVYHITATNDRDRVLKILEECHRDDQTSDAEVSAVAVLTCL